MSSTSDTSGTTDAGAGAGDGPQPDLGDLLAGLRREQYYCVTMQPTADWDLAAAIQGPLADHLRFLRDLEDRGVLVMAGPFMDETGAWAGDGMAIVRADSLAAARTLFADEPFAGRGLRTNDVKGWQLNEGTVATDT